MRPASGLASPTMQRNVVVLPDPLAPSMATLSPAPISRSRPSSTRRSPKVFVTPVSVSMVVPRDPVAVGAVGGRVGWRSARPRMNSAATPAIPAVGPRRARSGAGRDCRDQRSIVDRVVGRATAQSRGELQACRRRALQEDAGRRIGSFEALERADQRMRRVADAVAVEVEAAIAAPVVAAPVDAPARAGVAPAEDEIAPVVDELVAAEHVLFGAGEQRRRGVVRAERVVGEPVHGGSVEQQPARVAGDLVVPNRRLVAVLQRQTDAGHAAIAGDRVSARPEPGASS